MRTRTITAITAVLLLTTLTACGSDTKDQAESEPRKKIPASPSLTPELEFLTQAMAAGYDGWTDTAPIESDIMHFPKEWCGLLENGHSVDYVFGAAGKYPFGAGWGTKKPDAHKLLLLAVDTHCPTTRDQVTAELRDAGEY
ncbi:hypothetical protein [Streptomyces sp. CAU 1734]|uniref:hypothetical protein n=1 Tax=Streptomyces sp. CAU 1734 TaxID=3140360 RepID=UPI003260735F